jgi:hypothetical protein
MPTVPFDEIPDHARVWVFGATGSVRGEAADRLLEEVDRFLEEWHAHGRAVVGARELRHDRFLLIAADEEATGVSGCSIDSLFRRLRVLETETGIGLLDSGAVWFRGGDGEVRRESRDSFRRLAAEGGVTGDTLVFDNTVATVGEVRRDAWERRLADSWHGRAFRLGSPSVSGPRA